MRRFASTALVLALLAGTAHADKTTWEGVFVGSVGVALIGGAVLWHGSNQIDHAEENLCTGAYEGDSCDHAAPTLPSQIEHFNNNGDDGSTLVYLGGAMVVAGAAVGAVALYKAFIAKDSMETERVSITPALSPQSAGASLSLRW